MLKRRTATGIAVLAATAARAKDRDEAAARAQAPALRLDDADVARFVALVRATDFAGRARTIGDSGDQSEVVVIEDKRRASFTVVGADPAVDGLLAFLREISLRQFRDVIDSQPQAGERRR